MEMPPFALLVLLPYGGKGKTIWHLAIVESGKH